jgi:putative endopeptidase
VEQADEVSGRLRDLVWSDQAPLVVREFLASFTDLAARDRAATKPLEGAFRAIEELRGGPDLATLIARFNRSHKDLITGARFPTPTPFYLEVWADPRDPRSQLAQLAESGLGLLDRSYYFDTKSEPLLAQYRAHIQKAFALAGMPDSGGLAQKALAVETAIAKLQGDLAELQDGGRNAQPLGLEGLATLAPDFDWHAFFREAGLGADDELFVRHPQFVRDVTHLIATQPLSDTKAYLRWQLLRRYSPFLSPQYADAAFEFFGRTLQGSSEPQELRRMAQTYAEFFFAWELSNEYIERFLSAQEKSAAQAIAETVRAAYRTRIESADWLSDAARAEALRKLENLTIGMLYPEQQERPAPLVLSAEDLTSNLMKLSERAYEADMQRLRRPTQRGAWWDPPIAVSGSYSVTANTLIITAARASGPLFAVSADAPENYGGLGTLVAHEMGHAFDNQGSQYDANGTLRSWWSDAEKLEFERRAAALVDQYGRLEPMPGMRVDGRATLSENIADLSALTVGFEALRIERRRQGRDVSPDDKRRFFEAWARRWRVLYTEPLLVRVLRSDTHAPLQYRCSIPLSNFSPFYEAIGLATDSPLYRPMAERVSIW